MSDDVCYNTGKSRIFNCSNCGYGYGDIFIDNEQKYGNDLTLLPNYCPWCGRQVIDRRSGMAVKKNDGQGDL